MASDATVDDLTAGQDSAGELRCPFGGGGPQAAPGTRPKGKRGYFIPGIIALTVLAVIAIVIDVAGLQPHTPQSLSGTQTATYVSQSLQASHPQRNPPDVRCPGSEPVRAGVTFDCTVVRSGRVESTVRVTELGGGTLHVAPSAG